MAEAIERETPDAVWCLGDVVGYGPEPNGCCSWASAHTAVCLAGNHDLGVVGTLDLSDFSYEAAAAAGWTRETLDADARAFLTGLESAGREDGVALCHASPRDPVWEYVLTWDVARDAIRDSGAALTLVGHSHVPMAIGEGDEPVGGHAAGGTEIELGEGRWLLNPGSVGQPRDGDPRRRLAPPRP